MLLPPWPDLYMEATLGWRLWSLEDASGPPADGGAKLKNDLTRTRPLPTVSSEDVVGTHGNLNSPEEQKA